MLIFPENFILSASPLECGVKDAYFFSTKFVTRKFYALLRFLFGYSSGKFFALCCYCTKGVGVAG